MHDLEKGPLGPMFVHVTSKKAPIFYTCYTKFFILYENFLLRESSFHIVNCLKLYDFALFFVNT